MKTYALVIGIAALTLGCGGSGSNNGGGVSQTSDLQADFSTAANPNGSWTYGQTTTLGSLTPYDDSSEVAVKYSADPGVVGWDTTGADYPLVAKNTSASGTYFGGWNPGDVYLSGYSGGLSSVARWTDKVAGSHSFSIKGTFRRLENVSADPSKYWVLVNGSTVSSGDLVDLNAEATYQATLTLSQGDTVDFVVGNDGTNWGGTGLILSATIQTPPTA